MIALLKQELKFSPLCLVCLAGGWTTYLIDRRSATLEPQAAYMLGFFLSAGVIAAAISRELRDSHGGGYQFLKTLPLTDLEIVRTKFLALFFDVSFSWLLISLLFSVLPASPGILRLNLLYVTAWCLSTLAAVSLWYVVIYSFGFGTPTLALTLFLLGVLLPLSLILDKGLDFSHTLGFPPLFYSLANAHWITWIILLGLALSLCFGLFRIAVILKRTKATP